MRVSFWNMENVPLKVDMMQDHNFDWTASERKPSCLPLRYLRHSHYFDWSTNHIGYLVSFLPPLQGV